MFRKDHCNTHMHLRVVHQMTAAMQPDASQECFQITSALAWCAPNDSSHAARCFAKIIAKHICIYVLCTK
jgi:hypothetical protein